MKKIVLGLVLIAIGFVKLHAGNNVAILPSTSISKNEAVVCSSSTATLLFSANSYRKGMAIQNNGTYSIRVSTFASTSQSIGYTVNNGGGEFSDNIEAYNGVWYGISTGAGTSTVDVIEKQGVIYQ